MLKCQTHYETSLIVISLVFMQLEFRVYRFKFSFDRYFVWVTSKTNCFDFTKLYELIIGLGNIILLV